MKIQHAVNMTGENMTEDHKIPAASLDGLILLGVAKSSPVDADEMRRIGEMLDHGTETDDDMIRLCELLSKHGLVKESEKLLRCNIVEKDDPLCAAYRRLHGFHADIDFEQCIINFATQFKVTFIDRTEFGFLKHRCISLPQASGAESDPIGASGWRRGFLAIKISAYQS